MLPDTSVTVCDRYSSKRLLGRPTERRIFVEFTAYRSSCPGRSATCSIIDSVASEFSQYATREVEVAHLVVCPDVVDVTGNSLINEQVYCAAVIFHVQPVAFVVAVAVNGSARWFLTRFVTNSGITFSRKLEIRGRSCWWTE